MLAVRTVPLFRVVVRIPVALLKTVVVGKVSGTPTGEPDTPLTVVEIVLVEPAPAVAFETVAGGKALAGMVTPDGRGPEPNALTGIDPGVRQAIVFLQSTGGSALAGMVPVICDPSIVIVLAIAPGPVSWETGRVMPDGNAPGARELRGIEPAVGAGRLAPPH